MAKIAIAGASGFVGRFLLNELKAQHSIIALSRKSRSSDDENVEWRSVDFFSLKQAQLGLEGADVAYYLVHSMLPSARLTQGGFEDYDVIAADNFARAAKRVGIQQIIYLSGIVHDTENLSRHLRSRLEVESVLRAYGTPVTCLRAGLIIGPNGSSFQILDKLVRRLPMMILPKWTQSLTHPIFIQDVIFYLRSCLLKEESYQQNFEIGGPSAISYEHLIQLTARARGKKRFYFKVPVFSPNLSKLWVSLVTRKSREFVDPLVESLSCEMDLRDMQIQHIFPRELTPPREAVQMALEESVPSDLVEIRRPKNEEEEKDVRSVQRLVVPTSWDAETIVTAYLRWLPKFFRFILRVESDSDQNLRFYFSNTKILLLGLVRDEAFSGKDRQLLRIKSGILAHSGTNGRLEFRLINNGEFALAAIHDYRPKLPWFIYQCTQARIHLWVMKRFNRWLQKKSRLSDSQARWDKQAI